MLALILMRWAMLLRNSLEVTAVAYDTFGHKLLTSHHTTPVIRFQPVSSKFLDTFTWEETDAGQLNSTGCLKKTKQI